jgi:hypothetical protein
VYTIMGENVKERFGLSLGVDRSAELKSDRPYVPKAQGAGLRRSRQEKS